MTVPWYDLAFGSHYPLLYEHRDQAEARQCLELLQQLNPFPAEDPLLDLGCGQGRHLPGLAAEGLSVFGLDLSAELLSRAAELEGIKGVPLIRGDMRCLPLGDEKLGGVLSLFTAFGYFGDLPANAPVIGEIARVLRPGGVWYLDYVNCDQVRLELEDQEPVVRVRQIGPLDVRESRKLVAGGKMVEKEVHLAATPGREDAATSWGISSSGLSYTESVALFSQPEFEALAGKFRLRVMALAGSYSGDEFGRGPRWIMVLRKDGGR